jgi:hypothetical protein
MMLGNVGTFPNNQLGELVVLADLASEEITVRITQSSLSGKFSNPFVHVLLLFIHYTHIIQKESFLVNLGGQCVLTLFLQAMARVALILCAHSVALGAIAIVFHDPVAWRRGFQWDLHS